jgi:hypothetical protein
MQEKAYDKFVAHRSPPIWLLTIALICAILFIGSSLIIPTQDWVGDSTCPKLGCLILDPLFNMTPPIVRRMISFTLGVLFSLGIWKGILLRIKKPLFLVIDSTGMHIYVGSERHLNWSDVTAIVGRKYGITLKNSSPVVKSKPINLNTNGLDVTTSDIVTAIRKYRPDLQLTYDTWKY